MTHVTVTHYSIKLNYFNVPERDRVAEAPLPSARVAVRNRPTHPDETTSDAEIHFHRAGGAFLGASVEGEDTE